MCWPSDSKDVNGAPWGSKWGDRLNPMDQHANLMNDVQGFANAPPTAQMFGGAAREYRWSTAPERETFAQISVKARKHAANNPYAIFKRCALPWTK